MLDMIKLSDAFLYFNIILKIYTPDFIKRASQKFQNFIFLASISIALLQGAHLITLLISGVDHVFFHFSLLLQKRFPLLINPYVNLTYNVPDSCTLFCSFLKITLIETYKYNVRS